MSFPAEIYFAVCENVPSRRDLRSVASSSRVLQRPAEAALHHSIVIRNREHGRNVFQILNRYPRFRPFVKSLRLELDIPGFPAQNDFTPEYWKELAEMLGALGVLEHLDIEDGINSRNSWILSGLRRDQLRSLQCSFVIDDTLVQVLRKQRKLRDLSLKASLISLTASVPQGHDEKHLFPSYKKADDGIRLTLILNLLLGPESLPQLSHLHTESLSLARALVPGRPVSHIWCPGASFSSTVSSTYTYQHIHGQNLDHGLSEEPDDYHSLSLDGVTLILRETGAKNHASEEEHVAYLKESLNDFGRSITKVVALRMALNLTSDGLQKVLAHMSIVLPDMRVLGIIPPWTLEPTGVIERSVEPTPLPFPTFKNLHTICAWSTPSRTALRALEKTVDTLPSLHTLASLHYSAKLEWLCLPVKRNCNSEVLDLYDPIRWGRAFEDQPLKGDTRRATPLHDPNNNIWRMA